jgi:GntR family transcriptional regulator, rspAB operon transcriptional repressor
MVELNVYEKLKRQIILAEQKPGEIIREREIMKTFKVSRTPVREALMRLEIDGLVRIIPNVGTFVEEVSIQRLKDVFEIRSSLVQMAGELAAARITEQELAEMRQLINEIKSTKDTKKLMKLDGEIHQIINNATKNKVLTSILSGLHDQAIRFWSFSGAKGSYWENLEKEFQEITEALEQHDKDVTARLLKKHTEGFVAHIRSQLTF